MQFDPNQLRALAAILRLGSFEAAAAELAVTQSAISQRIRALEERVGAALIERVTPCTGTRAGLRIAKHAEDVGLLEAQLSRDLSLEQKAGPARLRIAVNADSLATWFVDAMAQVEDVLFDLVIDDQDHSADWLRRGAVSAAICSGTKAAPGCDAVPLGHLRYLATASPAFANRWFDKGVSAATLSVAPCMTFNRKDNLQQKWIEQVIGKRVTPPSHFLPSTQAFVDAACAGLGWGMNPESLAGQPIRDGKLVALLADQPLDVALSWQVSRVMAPALAPLTRAVKQAAQDGLIRAG
ncbi:ArgP/LysG family DNA-binding transcriptional regulator [Ruegeria sp. 2205SS24-7]|uniref:ArgP/LysG family DNA-binding transcriptional regulator n=1 Tax=Ruegeria discodermiae TaxID=3064389 RepID=UPI00274166E7|nr:ArgP/LysG family DNA-binding transcriptional regulator [Ruegeria sp. 2205SS24-7]MDP5217911.1 ArgP/LysG family DNA-binding transcriptional regulator [Ruegeria sp. 2205SS24-7]